MTSSSAPEPPPDERADSEALKRLAQLDVPVEPLRGSQRLSRMLRANRVQLAMALALLAVAALLVLGLSEGFTAFLKYLIMLLIQLFIRVTSTIFGF